MGRGALRQQPGSKVRDLRGGAWPRPPASRAALPERSRSTAWARERREPGRRALSGGAGEGRARGAAQAQCAPRLSNMAEAPLLPLQPLKGKC